MTSTRISSRRIGVFQSVVPRLSAQLAGEHHHLADRLDDRRRRDRCRYCPANRFFYPIYPQYLLGLVLKGALPRDFPRPPEICMFQSYTKKSWKKEHSAGASST